MTDSLSCTEEVWEDKPGQTLKMLQFYCKWGLIPKTCMQHTVLQRISFSVVMKKVPKLYCLSFFPSSVINGPNTGTTDYGHKIFGASIRYLSTFCMQIGRAKHKTFCNKRPCLTSQFVVPVSIFLCPTQRHVPLSFWQTESIERSARATSGTIARNTGLGI